MADTDLPPVPYNTPMLTKQGILTMPWLGFFRALFLRTGGNSAPTNNDILSNPMSNFGDTIYGGTGGETTALPGNTSMVNKFLTEQGNGSVAAAPQWSAIQSSDVPTLNQNTTGSAASLSQSLTQYAVILGNAPGVVAMATFGTAGEFLTSNGPGTPPTWQTSGSSSGGFTISGSRASPNLITAAGGVTSTSDQRLLMRVAGSGGPVTVTSALYISAGVTDGQELILEGSDASNTLTIGNGSGVEQAGSMTLGIGDKIAYLWNLGASVWTEQYRFFAGIDILTDDSGNPLTDASGNPFIS